MKVARNAPCPCGSGRKHKLCCGTTRDAERRLEAERRAREQALQLVASLPSLFPMLRPEGAGFEAWADATGERVPSCDDLDDAIVAEGVALIGEGERARLLDAAAAEVRWQEVVAPARDQEAVRTALLRGAVAAAVHDCHAFDPGLLALLEETPSRPDDPADAIALVLDACSLWSVDDASAADGRRSPRSTTTSTTTRTSWRGTRHSPPWPRVARPIATAAGSTRWWHGSRGSCRWPSTRQPHGSSRRPAPRTGGVRRCGSA